MKKFYESPDVQIVDLQAMEKLALIEDGDQTPEDGGQSVIPTRDW